METIYRKLRPRFDEMDDPCSGRQQIGILLSIGSCNILILPVLEERRRDRK